MNTILFDLDGTLIDSSEGIIKSVLYTLDFYGIEETDTTKLYQFIGPPLSESFEKFYGFSNKKAYDAVQKYRERYNKTGIFECKLYPGVEKCIRTLKEQGYRHLPSRKYPANGFWSILEFFRFLMMSWELRLTGAGTKNPRFSRKLCAAGVIFQNPRCV